MDLLCRDERETIVQVKPDHPAEHAECAGAGPVLFPDAVLQHVAKQFEILYHPVTF